MTHHSTADLSRRSRRVVAAWEVQSASYHRLEARRCRALAADCLHQPTGDVLRTMAAEHEAKAHALDAGKATLPG